MQPRFACVAGAKSVEEQLDGYPYAYSRASEYLAQLRHTDPLRPEELSPERDPPVEIITRTLMLHWRSLNKLHSVDIEEVDCYVSGIKRERT